MCSWCWGFRSAWHDLTSRLLDAYPELVIRNVVGGLAPDSDEPMPMEMRQMLQSTWQRIQYTIPNASFNYDFWRIGEPRRSTYPACRAVIASAQQGTNPMQSHVNENAMILAIQQAYYLQAKNPSNSDTLVACAESIGIDVDLFTQDLKSEKIQQLLLQNIMEYQRLAQLSGVSGFPSLVLQYVSQSNERYHSIVIDYNNPQAMLDAIQKHLLLG
jgi:putative protein-disulfide isomerase